jgi:integrase
MILAGVPVAIVSHKLGHANVSITLDLYAHVLPSDQSQANAAVEAMLAQGRSANAAMES